MKTVQTLTHLAPGESAIVESLDIQGDMRRRFLDLGLIEQTTIECIGRSPVGDPTAYLIRGTVIAIRAKDSEGILICKTGSKETPWD